MTKYTLRPYQSEATEIGLKVLKSKKIRRGYISIPTGGGKSLIIAEIIRRLGEPVCIFQPSKELLLQNIDKYRRVCGNDALGTAFSASAKQKVISPATFATIGTAVNEPEAFKNFRYFIIDECHLVPPEEDSMYSRFFAENGDFSAIGLTATPMRLKPYPHEGCSKLVMLHRSRPRFFTHLVFSVQNADMAKYWPNIKYVHFGFDSTVLQMNSTGRDFTEKSLAEAMVLNETLIKIRNLVNDRLAPSKVKNSLIFVRDIKEALSLSEAIPNSAVIHSKMKMKDRDKCINDFEAGRVRWLINVGILTIGYDFPGLESIILGRKTASLALYSQMVGRPLRGDTEQTVFVIDFVGNYNTFGPVEGLKIGEKYGKTEIFNVDGKVLTGFPVGVPNFARK